MGDQRAAAVFRAGLFFHRPLLTGHQRKFRFQPRQVGRRAALPRRPVIGCVPCAIVLRGRGSAFKRHGIRKRLRHIHQLPAVGQRVGNIVAVRPRSRLRNLHHRHRTILRRQNLRNLKHRRHTRLLFCQQQRLV